MQTIEEDETSRFFLSAFCGIFVANFMPISGKSFPKVAAGKLRCEPIVDALLKSFMSKVSKVERGCVERICTGQFFDAELAMELCLVLGKSKETKNFLQILVLSLRIRRR